VAIMALILKTYPDCKQTQALRQNRVWLFVGKIAY
jgi:hypothetical protein